MRSRFLSEQHDHGRRVTAGCAALLAVASALLGAAFMPAPALAIPEGRVYEMVSPLYKGGYGVNVLRAVAPDGESVAFASQGAFAEAPSSPALNEYLSRRGASGWSTTPLMPPASILPSILGNAPEDFSPTLDYSLAEGRLGPNLGAAEKRHEVVFLLHPSDSAHVAEDFPVAGMVLKPATEPPEGAGEPGYEGASSNFSHILFGENPVEPMLPAATEAKADQLYDLVTSGEGAPALRLVGLNDSGELINPNCPVALGTESGANSHFNAVSADGSEIFFTTSPNRSGGNCERNHVANPGNPETVFVRVDGTRTLQVSAPVTGDCVGGAPCASAVQSRVEFKGANENGSCVFFTTSQPLVTGDTDSGFDLYAARIGNAGEAGEVCAPNAGGTSGAEVASMVQVSHDRNVGEAADVQGVVAISPDGSRVYFVARGVLSEGVNARGQSPVRGADNLYVDETGSGGSPVFVADLCSGSGESGEARDVRCPSSVSPSESDTGLWLGSAGERQTAGDGRFLLFASYGQLLAGDTDAARDVYRYDAATGALDRVSSGEDGYDANGNNDAFNAAIKPEDGSTAFVGQKGHLTFRAISEDGSRVVFTTAEPLSSQATNGLENVYEWHIEPGWSEGRVSLISTGHSTEPVNEVLMSASGRDIFFATSEGLVPGDTDGAGDVYDARLGGGFPEPPAAREPCSGDACQGPLTNPAPLLVPGSVSQAPGENMPAPAAAPAPVIVKPKPKAKAKAKAEHRARHKRKKSLGKHAARAKKSLTREARR